MTNQRRDKKDDNVGPLILGLGALGAAAIVLTKGGGGGGQGSIVLQGQSVCSVIDPTKAQLTLDWTSTVNPVDTEYDLIEDGAVFGSAAASPFSALMPESSEGQSHSFKVRGRQSLVESNTVTLTIASCSGSSGNQTVTSVVATWT